MMTDASLGFVYRFLPPTASEPGVTLLLLHGTGGDEDDLIDLGRMLSPGSALLSPRGKVLEYGKPRFFKRLAEGIFDLDDLVFRAGELADFVTAASAVYGFDPARVIAVGFSNGANIAAAVLLEHPGILTGAILFRPTVPLEPDPKPDLTGLPVFISAGRSDPLVSHEDTKRLAALLRECNADVTVNWQEAGHALTTGDLHAAWEWLDRVQPGSHAL